MDGMGTSYPKRYAPLAPQDSIQGWQELDMQSYIGTSLVQLKERRYPYIYKYSRLFIQPYSGDVSFYRWVLDELCSFEWRTYVGCEGQNETQEELGYMFYNRPLLGRHVGIVEKFFISHVWRKFGQSKRVPIKMTTYAKVWEEEDMGQLPILDCVAYFHETHELQQLAWDYLPAAIDAKYLLIMHMRQGEGPSQNLCFQIHYRRMIGEEEMMKMRESMVGMDGDKGEAQIGLSTLRVHPEVKLDLGEGCR